ncbi:transcription factor DYT1-like [Apium graveolens]|uniref:transcription factor DYT1-like n=1 Tax=Apium graveolens TaxID=4045 RepID=UPI003D7BEB3D
MGGGRHSDEDTEVFKSKNLKAERRRREKLSSRLLELRDLITKPTIITDSISYIHELKSHVQELSDQIFAMEATINEHEQKLERPEVDVSQEMKNWGIEVSKIDNNKL